MGAQCTGGALPGYETFAVHETGFSIAVRSTRAMGWKRDLPDFRDRTLDLPATKTSNLPANVDLRSSEHFAIYDQGHLGSCTANALGAAFHYDQIRQNIKDFVPSRLFIYYNERAMEGTIAQDSGAYIRDGIKTLNKIGVCRETLWAYDEEKFTVKPSDACYAEAALNTCKEYARVPQTLEDMKGCLNEGFPFVFGFTVFSSFMTGQVAKTGVMTMPKSTESQLGGHAVCCVGYKDSMGCMIVRNSWGAGWGDSGYFYMPYEYITHPYFASDFWAIRSIDGAAAKASFPVKAAGLGR
mmetsp:Transcript_87398/g.219968  ORF Transcript_87398/g.219968 Transcript_87398/m.219968 type:complete len:297 (+) Transcript_87398:108-998(+)